LLLLLLLLGVGFLEEEEEDLFFRFGHLGRRIPESARVTTQRVDIYRCLAVLGSV